MFNQIQQAMFFSLMVLNASGTFLISGLKRSRVAILVCKTFMLLGIKFVEALTVHFQ